MKLLHIVAGMDTRLERDLSLLLVSTGNSSVTVCTLGPAAPTLEAQGVRVEALAWKRLLNPWPLWRLARLVREGQPDTIHVWGLPALRAFRLALGKWLGQVVVNRPTSSAGTWNALDRWLLRGVDRILVQGLAEETRCRQVGVSGDRLRVVPPGIALHPGAESGRPTIVCAGDLRADSGFWDALWTLDIVQFLDKDLEMVIAGEGPERARLQRFADNAGLTQRVNLVGETADRLALLSSATVVWVPSRADLGASVVLEAMAAGRPVIAARWPTLAELIVDGQTGWLVEPGNKMELAQRTYQLLCDPALRQRMGEAGRRRVAKHFATDRFVNAWWQAWTDLPLAA